jgi:hypothetical protein
MGETHRELPWNDAALDRHRHVCVFYHSGDEEFCTHDLSRFSASQAIDVLRSHPVAVVGGILQENPYFVPPEELLRELREQSRRRAGMV